MAAISGLQKTQYVAEFKGGDGVAVDYMRLAGAVPASMPCTADIRSTN